MRRRDFLKTTALAAGAAAAAGASESKPGKLPKRAYGKSGEMLSVICFGGIVVKNVAQPDADKIVAEAYERGVNYYDVAPAYGDAEVQLGPALAPYRKDCFLACKTAQRERGPAEEEFARSLERLKTDYFDLYQLHAITDVGKDVDPVFQKGGVMDMIIEKKKAGQIRHVGFSAHSLQAARTALSRYPFESMLVPINFASFLKENWGPQLVAMAKEHNCAILALKPMAKQKWTANAAVTREAYPKAWYEPLADPKEAAAGLRWTLNQPVVSAVPPGDAKSFRLALDIAEESIQLSDLEEKRVAAMAQVVDSLFPVVEGDA